MQKLLILACAAALWFVPEARAQQLTTQCITLPNPGGMASCVPVTAGNPLPVGPQTNSNTAALITHTAATTGASSADQTNLGGAGAQIGVNVTAITGTTPSVTVIIEGKDAASGTYYTLLSSAAITTTGFTLLSLHPGLTPAANTIANQVLPATWRVRTVIAGTTPAVTATVGASVTR
jgi:hypothetical protein